VRERSLDTCHMLLLPCWRRAEANACERGPLGTPPWTIQRRRRRGHSSCWMQQPDLGDARHRRCAQFCAYHQTLPSDTK
jgi:hypothetical protein